MARPRSPLPYPLVMIEWVDSSRIGAGWIDPLDIAAPDPSRCVSIGFLVSENQKGKFLIPTVANLEGSHGCPTHGGITIPWWSILSERRLA